jgi:hypothetical protein
MTICLGFSAEEKLEKIERYRKEHGIAHCVVLSPARFALDAPDAESIEWAEIIQYKFFYRLLQEIDHRTLIVINECLRTQNRHDLTYNCIRHYLNQTRHQLIFQHLPIIDTIDDFMILVDFETRSRWRRERFQRDFLRGLVLEAKPIDLKLCPLTLPADDRLREKYDAEKRKLFDNIGLKDPHTIPRNLHLLGGSRKLQAVRPDAHYLGRNNRFKLDNLSTFKDYAPRPSIQALTVFEPPHNFIDFSDAVTLSRQERFDVLTTDLPVDRWYMERYTDWTRRIEDAYANF